jgi:hypothetical protein
VLPDFRDELRYGNIARGQEPMRSTH